jgi:hypothetical protein
MLGQLQGLALVIRLEIGAIERFRAGRHALIDQAADDLAILDDEGDVAGTDFEHGPRALAAGGAVAEAGVEEARLNIRYKMFLIATLRRPMYLI